MLSTELTWLVDYWTGQRFRPATAGEQLKYAGARWFQIGSRVLKFDSADGFWCQETPTIAAE